MNFKLDAKNHVVEETMEDATRVIAAEIPRAPRLEDWIKFKEETGIDVDIDLNNRPASPDPSKILDRLEQIEKETQERFREEQCRGKSNFGECSTAQFSNSSLGNTSGTNDFDIWRQSDSDVVTRNPNDNVDDFFDIVSEYHSVNRERFRFPRDSDSQVE